MNDFKEKLQKLLDFCVAECDLRDVCFVGINYCCDDGVDISTKTWDGCHCHGSYQYNELTFSWL